MRPVWLVSLAVAAVLSFVAPSFAEDPGAVTPVEASRVCMMNDRVFDRPMIPIEVAGKTYFGCCEMCQENLGKNAELRASTDPVSGKPVDKASAVLGALPDGRVLYFENRENLEALSRRLQPGS